MTDNLFVCCIEIKFTHNLFFFSSKVVKTWQKREIKCEGKELSNFPSVINYIAGTKYGKPFVKVFCKYEDKEEERSIRMHSRPLQGTEYEFVNVPAKAGETEELEKIREKERDAPVLPDAIRIQLNKIINSKADAMYANFSTLTGLSVSTVRYKQGSFINDPCIVLYCLDKNLVPYGETQLPTIVGGYPCDKREGTFTLGSCADCRHNNPGPGCSIGMPSDSHTGSAGFLVKTTNSPYKTGFLTAAHVAIKDLLDLYDEDMFLSECVSMGNKNKEMVHPSYSQIDRNNYVGTVEESYIGDFGPYQEKISIDVAYVQSYTERRGGKTMLLKSVKNNLCGLPVVMYISLSMCTVYVRLSIRLYVHLSVQDNLFRVNFLLKIPIFFF